MSHPPAEFVTRMPKTLRNRLDRLSRRSGCSRNAYLNQLAVDAVSKERILKTGRVLQSGARKKANCKFV